MISTFVGMNLAAVCIIMGKVSADQIWASGFNYESLTYIYINVIFCFATAICFAYP